MEVSSTTDSEDGVAVSTRVVGSVGGPVTSVDGVDGHAGCPRRLRTDTGGPVDDDHGNDGNDGFDDDGFEDDDLDEPLDGNETALVRQDLIDLADFRAAFEPEGYRGVAVWCHDCVEEHYFPWEMLRENLQLLLETGETPVHEPAFQPDPDRYIPWDYARGYVDALKDVGADQRVAVDVCPRCGMVLEGDLGRANFCPRCGTTLLGARLDIVLGDAGLGPDAVADVVAAVGLPRPPRERSDSPPDADGTDT
jgi:hypothetical protein